MRVALALFITMGLTWPGQALAETEAGTEAETTTGIEATTGITIETETETETQTETEVLQAVMAEPPSDPIKSFSTAKRLARDKIWIEGNDRLTLYCGCKWTANARGTSGTIDPDACGYEIRKSNSRGKRIEWEHMMPASFYGHIRSCWTEGHERCETSSGKAYKGRKCCAKVDDHFEEMEADLHNLAPAIGELNADRSNHPYGEVPEEQRVYGQCDFEVGGDPKVAEPWDQAKGDVARAHLYMWDAYSADVPPDPALREMMERWHAIDPPTEDECTRNDRIAAEQGNINPYIACN